MSNEVRIEAYRDTTALPQTLCEEMRSLADTIREKAFILSQSRNGNNGGDVDDWLRAEREVLWSPAVELTQNEREFRAQIALPGFKEKDVKVTAAPGTLIVEAKTTHSHEENKSSVVFCEFSDKRLFRQLELPSPINVDKVTATLDRGILSIKAPKASQNKPAKPAKKVASP